jgi:trimeric autotransporter adhesin
MAFTGTPAEIAFKVVLARVLARNELSGSSPYELFWAGTAASGWTFGPLQYDVAGNSTARNLLADILLNAVDASGNYIADDGNPNTGRGTVGNIQDTVVSTLLQHASVTGGGGLSAAERAQINTALASAYGVNAIDSAVDAGLTDLMAFANRTTTRFARPADRPFLESDLGKLFLCDFANQYSTASRAQLQSFLQGNAVNGISIDGALGVDDLLNFYFRTANNRQLPWDGLRRFAGIVVETGYVPTNAAEASNVFRAATFHIHAPGNLDRIRASNLVALNEFVALVLNPARAVLLAAVQADYSLPAGIFGAGYDSLSIRLDPALPGVNPNNAAMLDARSFSGQVEVGNDDLLIGEGGRDTLIAGLGNDILIGGTGDDTLDGGVGNDVYVFRGGSAAALEGDGQDIIRDSDGIGSIRVGGTLLSGLDASSVIHPVFADRPTWRWTVDGKTYDFILIDGSLANNGAGTLWIEGDGIGLGSRIVVENFHQGDLGIFLPVNPQLQLLPEYPGILGPFADANYEPTTLSTTLQEGQARTVTLALNAPAQAGQTVRLSISDLDDALVVVTGLETREFVDGYIDLLLSAGQTQLTFSLVSRGDIDDDVLTSLSAVFLDGDGNPTGDSSSLSIDVNANAEDFVDPITTNIIDPLNPDSVQGPETEYVADYRGTAQNDLILTRSFLGGNGSQIAIDQEGGDDDMRGGDGADKLIGGSGNDSIYGGGYVDILYGDIETNFGTGNDILAGGSASDLLFGCGGNDQLWAGERGDLATAIATAEAQATVAGRGDFLVGNDGDDFLVGSGGFDVLAGGNGQDVLAGGGGDDLLVGDLSYVVDGQIPIALIDQGDFDWGWSIARSSSTQPDGSVRYTFNIADSDPFTTITAIAEDPVLGAADRIHGGAGNDGIFAGYGDDFADGGAGDDGIFGGGGNDTLLGGDGVDMLVGGDAADATGRDFIDGGADSDSIFGGHAGDVLYGGSGNDYIFGDDANDAAAGDDYINGEDGDDLIAGGAGADALYGGADNDSMYGDFSNTAADRQGDDFMDGGSGTDLLVGEGGADTLFGGAGDDQLFGESSGTPASAQRADYLDGGVGNDILVGGGAGDTLIGGEGDDQLFGDASDTPVELQGQDHLQGGAGADILQGLGGDDTLLGGADADGLSGGDGNDYLDGGEGNDTLQGGAGDDVLFGGKGIDTLVGGDGNDTYILSANDLLIEGGLADGIIDTAGDNRIMLSDLNASSLILVQGSQAGSINITNEEGTIGLVVRNALNGSIAGFAFADGSVLTSRHLIGTYYDGNADQESTTDGATLIGGNQADTISAYGNSAVISGGAGNDLLIGGDGSTTYQFDRGDGVDTIADASMFDATEGESRNVLELGAGILREEVSVVLSAGSGHLSIELGADDALDLTYPVDVNDIINGARTFDEIRFADGSVSSWQQFLADSHIVVRNDGNLASYSGTSSHDEILGSSGGETVNAGAGDDILRSSAGNDTLIGGAGSDSYLFARGGGADTLVNSGADAQTVDRLLIDLGIAPGEVNFYRVADSLLVRIGSTTDQVLIDDYFGANEVDEIVFSDGTVYTRANVPAQGPPPNEINYSLGSGAQTFTINDPTDSIVDRLRFGANVDPQSVVLGSNSGGDLVVRFRLPDGSIGFADSVTITDGVTNAATWLNEITFDANPAVVWTAGQIQEFARLPTEGRDFIYGTAGSDTLQGLEGDDSIQAGAGDDVLFGGAGSDFLSGDDGNDTLWGGEGEFDDLRGGSGNDVLVVEDQNTRVRGEAGNDTFVVNRGGYTTIDEIDASGVDVVLFGPGIAADDVEVRLIAGSLHLTVLDRTQPGRVVDGEVVLWSYFSASRQIRELDEVRFTDDPGTVWRYADLFAFTLIGNDTNEVLSGSTGNDIIRGNGGNDTLNGLEGADDLDGGAGIDQANGGAGDDVYRFSRSSQQDEVFDASGTDRIEFAADIAPTDVALYRVSTGGLTGAAPTPFADSLLIVVGGNELLIENYFAAGDGARVEELRFAGGVVWDTATIAANTVNVAGTLNSQTGTSGDDSFTVDHSQDAITEAAAGGTDTVTASVTYTLGNNLENLTLTGSFNLGGTGNGLNNVITGNSSNNVLNGNVGVDTLIGGDGNDIYHVHRTGSTSFDETYDNFDDIVVEQAGGGIDTIMAFTYSAIMPEHVERFILTSTMRTAFSFPIGADLTERFLGNALDNYIDVSAAAPFFSEAVRIDGGAGADVMVGGGGRNIYVIDNTGDVIVEPENGGVDTIESYLDYTLSDIRFEHLTLIGATATAGTGNGGNNDITGNGINNVLSGLDGNDRLYGGGGDDTLHGGLGNDDLDGNVGADTMIGGLGDDDYVVDSVSDVVVESAGEGRDGVGSYISYTLGDNFEQLGLLGFASVNATGNAADNRIGGNTGNNALDGGAGNDELYGGLGNDRYVNIGSTSGHDRIQEEGGFSDQLHFATSESIDITQVQFSRVGFDLEMTLSASSSVAISFWYSATQYVVETLAVTYNGLQYFYSSAQMNGRVEGINTGPQLNASMGSEAIAGGQPWTMQFAQNVFSDIESQHSLTYTAALGDGSPLPEWLSFDAATRTFSGTPPTTAIGSNVDLRVTATDAGGLSTFASFLLVIARPTHNGTSGDDHLVGIDADEIFTGFTGNDVLEGLGGADEMHGDAGDDTLDGGTGADDMSGGVGNDIFYVDVAGDIVREGFLEGTDEVRSTITYTLTSTSNLENLTLLGTSAINGTGNSSDNVLIGNVASNTLSGGSGNDTLDGGAANDSMSGGQGNDIYFVDHAMDTTSESSGQGSDTVRTTVNWTLASNVENLVLLGAGNLTGTGNSSANQITGNGGNNTLNGMGGADTLTGAGGNDTYVVDNVGDIVTEAANEGTDTVQSSIAYTLGNDVENLTLTSTAATGTGNGLDNVLIGNGSGNTLTGNGGNDTLDGGSGSDTMVGGAGNDTYVVAQTGDVVTETAGNGTDTVQSSIAYTLSSTNEVENLTLTGSSNVNGIGNSLNNVLSGNSGNNTLTGNAGSDSLAGGNGADIYSYSSGHGADTIDNSSTDSAQDRLNVTNLTSSQVTFTRSGNDLVMTRNGTATDNVRVLNWFTVTGNQLDFVQFTNQTLTAAQINAMFPSLMSSAQLTAPLIDEPAERWDRSFAVFVDAMNHFGGRRNLVVDRIGGASQEASGDWLARPAVEVGGNPWFQGSPGERRQLV